MNRRCRIRPPLGRTLSTSNCFAFGSPAEARGLSAHMGSFSAHMNSHYQMETSLFCLHFMYINPQIPHPSVEEQAHNENLNQSTSIPPNLRLSEVLDCYFAHLTSSLNALGTLAVKTKNLEKPWHGCLTTILLSRSSVRGRNQFRKV